MRYFYWDNKLGVEHRAESDLRPAMTDCGLRVSADIDPYKVSELPQCRECWALDDAERVTPIYTEYVHPLARKATQ